MNDLPEGYCRHVIETVRDDGDALIITYSGRIFGGISTELLPEGGREAIRPGAEIIVRLHEPETGPPGQIAHVAVRDPHGDGWIEVYEDL